MAQKNVEKKSKSEMIPCSKCKHQVSKTARTCPNCGHPVGKLGWLLENKLLVLISSILGFLGVNGLFLDEIKAGFSRLTGTVISSPEQAKHFTVEQQPSGNSSSSASPSSGNWSVKTKIIEEPCPNLKKGIVGIEKGIKCLEICPECDGKGRQSCKACGGDGLEGIGRDATPCKRCNAMGTIPCEKCKGKKYIPCTKCGGSGIIKKLVTE